MPYIKESAIQIPIESQQIIRSRRKTLALIVKPDGSLIVRAPWRASERSIREFIEANTRWIEKKQAEALAATPPASRQYLPGETFMYLGDNYPLDIVDHQSPKLILDECFRLATTAQDCAAKVFKLWYRQNVRQILHERVKLYSQQYGFQYQSIRITSARSRWGSCSASGSLNFSWRLIMAPLGVVDYVVIHELVHTVVHNHSKRFWKKVESILPDYKERRKWLRKNGSHLMIS